MKTILVLSLLLVSALVYGQNAKIKVKNFGFKYDFYPEVTGYEENQTYSVHFKDRNGERFSYSEGNTPQAKAHDIYCESGLGWGFKWLVNSDKLLIEINQLEAGKQYKSIQSYQDPNTQAKRFSYEIKAMQRYQVKIIDLQQGNKVISDFTKDVVATAYWPEAATATTGYMSEKLLADNYRNQEQTVEGFFKKIDAKLMRGAYVFSLVEPITLIMHEKWKHFDYMMYGVKTKDPKFDLLDSAFIYLDLGTDEISKNRKAGTKGNSQQINAKTYFQKAHHIFQQYNTEEYLNWFTDAELKNEYQYGMLANLYLTHFLLGEYDAADQILAPIASQIDAENAKVKSDTDDGNPFAEAKSILKRSDARKAYDSMMKIENFVAWEKRLNSTFKARYGY